MQMKDFKDHLRRNSFTRFGPLPRKYDKLIWNDPISMNLKSSGELLKLEQMKPPMDDESLAELMQLKERMKNISKEELSFAIDSERREVEMYAEFGRSIGIDSSKEYVDEIFDFTDPILYHLKKLHDRARPEQLARRYGVDFRVLIDHEANHPAYPSGHSYDSRVMEYIFSGIRPIKKKEIQDFCKRMSDSRMNVGLHYPTDIEMGFILADEVIKTGLLDIFMERLSE